MTGLASSIRRQEAARTQFLLDEASVLEKGYDAPIGAQVRVRRERARRDRTDLRRAARDRGRATGCRRRYDSLHLERIEIPPLGGAGFSAGIPRCGTGKVAPELRPSIASASLDNRASDHWPRYHMGRVIEAFANTRPWTAESEVLRTPLTTAMSYSTDDFRARVSSPIRLSAALQNWSIPALEKSLRRCRCTARRWRCASDCRRPSSRVDRHRAKGCAAHRASERWAVVCSVSESATICPIAD